MVILKYTEGLISTKGDLRWVYDVCTEMPQWSLVQQDFIFKRKPKRVSAQEARRLIKENNLICVCDNEYGKIYTSNDS